MGMTLTSLLDAWLSTKQYPALREVPSITIVMVSCSGTRKAIGALEDIKRKRIAMNTLRLYGRNLTADYLTLPRLRSIAETTELIYGWQT